MIEGFNKEKCNRRNRIMAARGNVESSPIRFVKDFSNPSVVFVSQTGTLPSTDLEALAIINASLPASSDPLTLSQVYIHYIEAASNVLISDRHAFFATSTLVNIAKGGTGGVAFMNSHRTGSISSPGELPFGKTFAGRYEATLDGNGDVQERSILGFYMLRGIAPNGENGPSTDTLHTMIDGGGLFDVSVGLLPGTHGRVVCDVCGGDYRSCEHVAGTTRKMTEAQVAEAKSRGVSTGNATYTIEDYELSEVSGVYDGAVPGAGFSKGLSMLTQLSDEERAQFKAAFQELMEDDSKTTISTEGGSTGPSGAGKVQAEKPGDTKKMKDLYVRALAAIGLGKMAAAVALGDSDKPESIAATMASQVDSEVAERIAAHPLIIACNAAGITTGAQLTSLVETSKLGEKYAADLREDAKREAIRAYGHDLGAQVSAQVANLSPSVVESMRNSWRAEADAKFGTSGEAGGKRKSAPEGATPTQYGPGGEQTPWQKLTDAQRAQATKMGANTPEKQNAFALNLLATKEGA